MQWKFHFISEQFCPSMFCLFPHRSKPYDMCTWLITEHFQYFNKRAHRQRATFHLWGRTFNFRWGLKSTRCNAPAFIYSSHSVAYCWKWRPTCFHMLHVYASGLMLHVLCHSLINDFYLLRMRALLFSQRKKSVFAIFLSNIWLVILGRRVLATPISNMFSDRIWKPRWPILMSPFQQAV